MPWLEEREYSTGLVDGSIRLASRTLTHRDALVGGAEVSDWLQGGKEDGFVGVVLQCDDRVICLGISVLVNTHRVALNTCRVRNSMLYY